MAVSPRNQPKARAPLPTVQRLGRVVAAHNLRVVLLAAMTLTTAAGLWMLLYAFLFWMALLLVSVAEGPNAVVPPTFATVFGIAALALVLVAWIDRRLNPDDRPRDTRTITDIVLELILALPRATLSVWGTLSAWLALDGAALREAAALIDRLSKERRILLHSVPLEVPDEARRLKVLFALQVLQVIDLRRVDRELWLVLSSLRPRELGGRTQRQLTSGGGG